MSTPTPTYAMAKAIVLYCECDDLDEIVEDTGRWTNTGNIDDPWPLCLGDENRQAWSKVAEATRALADAWRILDETPESNEPDNPRVA